MGPRAREGGQEGEGVSGRKCERRERGRKALVLIEDNDGKETAKWVGVVLSGPSCAHSTRVGVGVQHLQQTMPQEHEVGHHEAYVGNDVRLLTSLYLTIMQVLHSSPVVLHSMLACFLPQ